MLARSLHLISNRLVECILDSVSARQDVMQGSFEPVLIAPTAITSCVVLIWTWQFILAKRRRAKQVAHTNISASPLTFKIYCVHS
jgi:hypothetical protein